MNSAIIFTKKAPKPVGHYSQAIAASGGGLIFTAGQIPINPETNEKVLGGFEEECLQVLKNLQAVVESAGSSLDKVIKVTVFLKNLDDFPKVNKLFEKFFTVDPPARSVVEVSHLPGDVSLEIEAVALVHDA